MSAQQSRQTCLLCYNWPMQILSTQKPSAAKGRILQTARTLFYRDGIRATGVDRIIAEASVTKTTFYRHFKSKNNLIITYLEQRDKDLLKTLEQGLQKNGGDVGAIVLTFKEWFDSDNFRGCAFLNSVGEVGEILPEVVEITQRHKQAIADMLEMALPESPNRSEQARMLALAVDGATVKAQYDKDPAEAVALLKLILKSITFSQN